MGTLSTLYQEENLSVQVVKTSILNEEIRRKDKGVMFKSEANVLQHLGRLRNIQRRDKSHAKSKSRSKFTCFYCGKPGHIQKDY